jgi:hypothetical protein
MSVDHGRLFTELADRQPPDAPDAPVSVPALVQRWLAAGPKVLVGDDRADLDALCRQIDVRRKVSVAYGEGFTRLDPESPAPPAVVSGLVAVLLANAVGVGGPGPNGSLNDGWGLKCTNSALKALELREDAPLSPSLRAWALETLDRARTPADDAGTVA